MCFCHVDGDPGIRRPLRTTGQQNVLLLRPELQSPFRMGSSAASDVVELAANLRAPAICAALGSGELFVWLFDFARSARPCSMRLVVAPQKGDGRTPERICVVGVSLTEESEAGRQTGAIAPCRRCTKLRIAGESLIRRDG